jgi:superfamily II DNA or RNA helicase
MKKELRSYQLELSKKAVEILRDKKIVYLNFSVRTGKTATALETCRLYGAKKVLFLTKKKAITSIQNDYMDFGYKFDLRIINNESLSKVIGNDFDVVIQDEAHGMASFPKPSNKAKEFKARFSRIPLILLSGTMAAESYSQVYHQFYLSAYSPFSQYKNFYAWSKVFTQPTLKYVSYGTINDYSCAKIDLIDLVIQPYILKFTQENAGFESKVNEKVIYFDSCNKKIIDKLKKDNIVEGKEEVILADSGVKMMSKLHQLESGTIKFESGNSMVIDNSKALFIAEHFKSKKLAIFYYYIEEFHLLQFAFPNHTTDIEEFNTTDKHYIGQQYSSAMGINLSSADCLVFFNFGFSGTNYIQSIDRLTTISRKENDVYFIYGKGSLTEQIHQVVKQKKTFTLKQFEKC